jgi:hypothetical protein
MPASSNSFKGVEDAKTI